MIEVITIKISKLTILYNHRILFHFSDGSEKEIDFTSFIGTDALTSPLQDQKYFSQVQIYENGRGIFWPNGYDVCPDYLRYYSGIEQLEILEHSSL